MIQSIPELLEQYRVEYRRPGEHHHATRGRVSVDCPWCSPSSRRFRLGLSIYSGSANCWTCGKKDRFQSLLKLTGCTSTELSDFLKGLPKYRKFDANDRAGQLVVPSGLVGIRDIPAYWDFLVDRRFDPDEISEYWGVKGTLPGTQYQWRLWIPIQDVHGQVVSWTTRTIGQDTEAQRYISANPEQEATPHKHLLYGAHRAVSTVVVVEGPTDVWAIGPGAVATFGTSFTPQQVSALSKYPVRIVCYDNEPLAQRQARKLCRELMAFPGTTENVVLETGSDPGDASDAELMELRSHYRF